MSAKPITFTMEQELLNRVDARAKALGLTRSGYLAMLARRDIADGGPLVLHELTPRADTNVTPPRPEPVHSYPRPIKKLSKAKKN